MLHNIDKSQNPENCQDSKYLQDADIQSVFVLKKGGELKWLLGEGFDEV